MSLPDFSASSILVFGEVLADVFPDRSVLGGAPFNVACHLAAFGENPLFISRTGEDSLRQELIERMHRLGMTTRGVQIDPAHPTGEVQVQLDDKGGHVFRIKEDQAYDYIDTAQALAAAVEHQPRLFYFGTLAQRGTVSRTAFRALNAQLGCTRLADINLREPWFTLDVVMETLAASDVVKMSLEELQWLARELPLPGSEPELWVKDLAGRFQLERVLITCGADGAWQWQPGQEQAIINAPPGRSSRAIIDTIGAGDAFTAVIMLGLLRKWPDALSLNRANAFARAVCGIRGALPADRDFYTPFLEVWDG